ncbi:hypothetical protein NQZ79_g4189 [Umbelopsis isabellina]|nr:hypothetical protein NQZ79_g4189 [Umbelopsis isabellina]
MQTRIAYSTFRSVHAITSKISPVPSSSGIEVLEAETFKLVCTQTLTGNNSAVLIVMHFERLLTHSSGTKFLIVTDPQHQNVDALQKKVYDLYSNYVMKNPFHTPEMPIRSDQFDVGLSKLISEA